MKPETLSKLKFAFLRAALFIIIAVTLRILFNNSNEEPQTLNSNIAFGCFLFLPLFILYYFTYDKEPTWSDVFKIFKRKKQ